MSFVNHMQQAIARAQTNVGNMRIGFVSSSNPTDSTIKVLLQPENVEIGPVQYSTPWIGWFSPPSPGQLCMVLFQEGSKDVPIGALMLYYNQNPPSAVAGEAIMYHSKGAFIKLINDGSIEITTSGDSNPININSTGNIQLNSSSGDVGVVSSSGNVSVSASTNVNITAPVINLNGNVTITGTLIGNNGGITVDGGNITTTGSITATENVVGGGISLNSHVHGGVTSGGANTGGPA